MARTLTHGEKITPATFTGNQASSLVNDSGQPDDQAQLPHVLVERADGTFFDEGKLPSDITLPNSGTGLLGALGYLLELALNTSGTVGNGINVRVVAGGGSGGGIASSVTVTNTVAVAGAVSVSNFPATQPVSGTVSVGNFPATQAVSGTVSVGNFPATQAISAASLPLPTGAATAAKQPALGTAGTASADVLSIQGIASMTPVAVSGTVGISGTATVAGAVSVSNFPATQPVSGTVSVGNFPATQAVSGTVSVGNFPATQAISATSLPLPAGAATAAKQPALGTAGAASSDVITIQGIASMVPLKTDGSGVTQPVSGTVSVGNFPATQPVSGTVSVGNFPATQAISAASLPLPTGAAIASKQPALGTAGTPSADVLTVQGASSGTPLPTNAARGSKTLQAQLINTTDTLALAANTARKLAILTNPSTSVTVYLGPSGVSTTVYSFALAPGATYLDGDSTDAWHAIVASGSQTINVTEIA